MTKGEKIRSTRITAKTSIRRLLIVSLTILSITPVLLLSGTLSWQSYIIQLAQAKDIQSELSKLASIQIVSYIHEQELVLNSVVTNIDIISVESAQRQLILSKVLSSSTDKRHGDIISDLVLLDGRGKEMTRVSRSAFLKETDLGSRAMSDEFMIPARSGETYYSPVYFDEQTGEPFLKISVPITDLRTMKAKGVLSAELRMNYIWDVIAHIHVGESGTVYLTDKNGRIIAHPNPSVVLRGTYFSAPERPGITRGLNGDRVVLATEKTQFGEQTLYVVTELPVAEALRNTYRSLFAGLSFLAVTLFCALALGVLLVRRIVRPVESLALTADAISKGDLSRKAEFFKNDETGTLADAFNGMTSKLVKTINVQQRQMVELQKADDKIIEQNEMLSNILNSLTQPFYVINAEDYKVVLANSASRFGSRVGNSACYELTHKADKPCEDPEHPCIIEKIKKTGKPMTVEHIHYDAEGNQEFREIHGYPILSSDGKIKQVIEYSFDITGRRKAEEKIKASLQEKEVLLREIHHRVKNNMQIVSSILQLQSGYIEDKQLLTALRESKNRIDMMALIHEKLYQSKSLSRINFQEYIDELVTSLLISYGVNTEIVRAEVHAEGVFLDINTAIPCGLIINELVSNCLKHAFPGNRGGRIVVAVTSAVSNYTLIVSDDGVGFPENLDFADTGTLGLKLVMALTSQLNGTIEKKRDKGTAFIIIFPELKYRERV